MNTAPVTAQADIDQAVVAERRRIVAILGLAGHSAELRLMARRCVAVGLSTLAAGRLMKSAPLPWHRTFWAAIADLVNGGPHLAQAANDGGDGR